MLECQQIINQDQIPFHQTLMIILNPPLTIKYNNKKLNLKIFQFIYQLQNKKINQDQDQSLQIQMMKFLQKNKKKANRKHIFLRRKHSKNKKWLPQMKKKSKSLKRNSLNLIRNMDQKKT